ncbi:MAG: AMP-binding protein [Chloroflexota bacterium]
MDNQAQDTLPKLLLRNAKKWPRRAAIREKDLGIWQTYTWVQYLENVSAFALGLHKLGFKKGDRLGIIGDNRPQLYWAMAAAQSLGGMPVPLYQDAIAQEVQHVLQDANVKMLVAEDQEQVDKILELFDQLPMMEKIIYDDPRGMRNYENPNLLSYTDVQIMGEEQAKSDTTLFEKLVNQGQGDDIAIIPYTSGTTSRPKGVLLTHTNLISAADMFVSVQPVTEKDELMAYLPMAWAGDHLLSYVFSISTGASSNCPEQPQTVQRDIREIGPTSLFAPPRIWENMVSMTQVKVADSDWIKRKIANYFIDLGMAVAKKQLDNEPLTGQERWMHRLGEPLVYGPLRDQLGLRRVRFGLTAGAAIAPEILLFFHGMGVNLKQLWAMTETGALGTMHRDGDVNPETVGPPVDGVDMKISESGELLVRGPNVSPGYLNNEEANADSWVDGWLRTGDAAIIQPDGHIVVVDRVKDVSKLADGTVFAPQYIENKVKFSPYVKEAVALGDDEGFVSVMINIDLEVMSNWAERNSLAYTGYIDLAQKAETYDLLHDEVARINQTISPELQVKRFLVLHKELDPDDEEVTRTRKVRRGFVAQKYANIKDALYTGKDDVVVNALVTYEDGRTSEIERELKIKDVTN